MMTQRQMTIKMEVDQNTPGNNLISVMIRIKFKRQWISHLVVMKFSTTL